MSNRFGKVSRVCVRAGVRNGKTILKDVSFTAPYKVMVPFAEENGLVQVMPLCASAGIMEGDCQEFEYQVEEGAALEVLSQSFEKIHKMDKGSASRKIQIQVERDAILYYYPQPVIPFAGSAFDSDMCIRLADESAKLFLLDILSCGRTAYGERFLYRHYCSRVRIYRGDRLIYRDHTKYVPEEMPMEGIGMYEGYTHMENLFFTASGNPQKDAEAQEKIQQILDDEEECDGGVSRLSDGDFAFRIFGKRAQKLVEVAEKIKQVFDAMWA